jgi:hypothetical protein
LTRYINDRRKKEETRKKAEKEAQKKTMVVAQRFYEGQSCKDVRIVLHGWSKISPSSC